MPRTYDEDKPPYIARVIEKVENRPGTWNSLRVGVFHVEHRETSNLETKVGEYIRNYSSLFDTFYPFERDGVWYALYSRDYTSTRLMKLPECEDIGGEERNSWGFCPTGYYVPVVCYETAESEAGWQAEKRRQQAAGEPLNVSAHKMEFFEGYPQWGLISGCIWGDDTSWKVQYLDLSRAPEGIVVREERFGYIELPRKVKLRDAVDVTAYELDFPRIEIALAHHFDLNTGYHPYRDEALHPLQVTLNALRAWHAVYKKDLDPRSQLSSKKRMDTHLLAAADDLLRTVGDVTELSKLLSVVHEWTDAREWKRIVDAAQDGDTVATDGGRELVLTADIRRYAEERMRNEEARLASASKAARVNGS